MAKQSRRRRARSTSASKRASNMVFTRRNYILLLLGVLAIVVGYIMMRLENEVDGFISLYVAPLVILGGYLEIIYAILWRPKTAAPEPENAPA